MNGKKVKKLRKLAEKASVGLPLRQYQDKALNPRKPTRRTRFLYNCTRLIHRNLKTMYKQGKLGGAV